jgi:hypothetical protein
MEASINSAIYPPFLQTPLTVSVLLASVKKELLEDKINLN